MTRPSGGGLALKAETAKANSVLPVPLSFPCFSTIGTDTFVEHRAFPNSRSVGMINGNSMTDKVPQYIRTLRLKVKAEAHPWLNAVNCGRHP
jgi:hypothetical protein